MIWVIVSKEEMEGYDIPPVFRYYREVIGKDNAKLVVLGDNDNLDFINKGDKVLLRSADKKIIDAIKKQNLVSTSEFYSIYEQVRDKVKLGAFLQKNNVLIPKQICIDEIKDGKMYFVKPRFGSESFGITKDCICKSKNEVQIQMARIQTELNQEPMIEEFINGIDCTVACYRNPNNNEVYTHSIGIECNEVGGIQTHKGKFDYNEYCFALEGDVKITINDISKRVFELLNIKHHARIDYRKSDDSQIYLIDINLLPGLGPSAHFSKCLLLSDNLSYKDAINAVLNSASL